jgi:hypothetical protein
MMTVTNLRKSIDGGQWSYEPAGILMDSSIVTFTHCKDGEETARFGIMYGVMKRIVADQVKMKRVREIENMNSDEVLS